MTDLERFTLLVLETAMGANPGDAKEDELLSPRVQRLKELLRPIANSYSVTRDAYIAGTQWCLGKKGYDPVRDFETWWGDRERNARNGIATGGENVLAVIDENLQHKATIDAALRMLVRLARLWYLRPGSQSPPSPGDLVVEITKADADGIGWLIDHGEAPYERDAPAGSPTREVWDIEPLSGRRGADGGPVRWENAEFVALPETLAVLARAAFPRR